MGMSMGQVVESVKVFADGASLASIEILAKEKYIKGFTTNPTLMRQAGVDDYLKFASSAIELIGERPLSLEVFSDDLGLMKREALKLASLDQTVNVKIPITNTAGVSCMPVVAELAKEGVCVNITAVFTLEQVDSALEALSDSPGYVSVFAGRIADAGIDPLPTMISTIERAKGTRTEVIWASPREVLNVVQAAEIGCHIITVTPDLIKKFSSLGKDLNEFSLDTVKMFSKDAQQAGYVIV
jgi:transaldolase